MCCATIDRIETAGPGAKARRLVFDDGLEPRITSPAAVRELGLQAGLCTEREVIEDALDGIEYRLAKDRALMLLGYREHSSAEMQRKLLDCGYPQGVAHAVAQRLIEVELIDDARFAGAWVRSRQASGYGIRRIRQELTRRGIDSALIDAALEDTGESDSEVERARAALRGRVASDRAGRDRLLRRLITRGFSMSVGLQALDARPIESPIEDPQE